MAVVKRGHSWFGLSTDTKPTPDPKNQSEYLLYQAGGVEFVETDTGNVYFWNGATWVIKRQAVTGVYAKPLNNALQAMTASAAAVTSAALGSSIFDFVSMVNCIIAIDTDATSASGYFCLASQTYRFGISIGETVSVLGVGAAGLVYISEVG